MDAYLRTIIDTAPDVIFAQDRDGRIRMANRAMADVLGKPIEKVIGRLHSELTPRVGDVRRLKFQVDEVLSTGVGNSTIRAIEHPVTGEVRYFETRVVPLEPPEGGPMQALVVATDFTNRQRAEMAARHSQQEILTRLVEAVEFRDDATSKHARRVGKLAAEIARLIGLSEEQVQVIEFAARLHDIGKIGIPDSILLKRGRLTEAEFAIMKTHTTIGAKLLSDGNSGTVSVAAEVARTHHERWDGTGYPAGLREEEAPIASRIVWVADVADALSHARPYRPAFTPDQVIVQLGIERNSLFDPTCVDACLEVLTSKGDWISWAEA